jgi:oxalate decarboxylase/phosphoglucose isomerase-like protein (cupin superfamily)
MARILDEAGRHTSVPAGTHWVEHTRSPHLSVGTYSLANGATDDQTPHTEDEIYVVTSGRARFAVASGSEPVSETSVDVGSVIYVAAGEVHAFLDPSDDFSTVVVFGPPESSEDPAPGSS